MISKKSVETWCNYNNYLLVNLKDEKVPIAKIVKIAERSVNIHSIHNNRAKRRNVFAKDIALAYLIDKYPRREIAAEMNLKEITVINASRKKNILNEEFKDVWRKNAVIFFKDKIKKIESSL